MLEKMADGDLSANTQEARSFFSSEKDEVGRLQKSIESYRQHRIEAEEDRINRAKRRDERDEIMFEKMTLLSDQLEGQSKDMLLTEISEMKDALSTGDDETKETASIELMSRAFSKMSDEVNALIAARTHELVEARDEISSSIRYAARLQNALLPKSFPGDFTINVEWRPRDLVGGDIYFIKDLPDKVYIAVVDCTGHGVPGAFLSIIARSQLEKAIDEEHYQSAGQYLSLVNDLLRETLSRADQSNMGEEGFDGGVCIYFRKEQRLEFAGAKASIFNVDSDKADEVAGDRKSVGSTRMASDFQFTTHVIEKNEGAFVMLTDGITDVMSPEERPIAFGRRRVLKILRESVNTSPGNIVSNIMTSVDLYRGGEPLRDDLTLLAFSMNSGNDMPETDEVVGDKKMKFEKTQRTPLVEIGSNSCLIKGECYPENIAEWSGPVLEALKKTLVDANTQFNVDIELYYFNSSSAKFLFDFFEFLEDSAEEGKNKNKLEVPGGGRHHARSWRGFSRGYHRLRI